MILLFLSDLYSVYYTHSVFRGMNPHTTVCDLLPHIESFNSRLCTLFTIIRLSVIYTYFVHLYIKYSVDVLIQCRSWSHTHTSGCVYTVHVSNKLLVSLSLLLSKIYSTRQSDERYKKNAFHERRAKNFSLTK